MTIKACKIHEITGKTVIAEDSGFEFDYLNGEPGIYSKRYLLSSPFEDKINIILTRMKDATKPEQRGMTFKGSVVCITSNKTLIHQDFSLSGFCAYEPHGVSATDYDRIMYLPNYAKTVAELLSSQRYKINPRIEAIRQVYKSLREV